MPTPKIGYRLADGTRIPGVTTVIGQSLGWSKDALVAWAWKQGRDGFNFRETKDAAADAGTLTHAMVDDHIHGRPFVPPPSTDPAILAKAEKGFAAYLEWQHDSRLTVIATELLLVSERYRYGGTPDAIAMRGERGLVLLDWKTSNSVYGEAIIQCAAYCQLWEEITSQPITSAYVVRFSKDVAGMSLRWVQRDALAGAWRAFLALRELYDLKKEVEALAK